MRSGLRSPLAYAVVTPMKTRANSFAGGGASTRRSACAAVAAARSTSRATGKARLMGTLLLPVLHVGHLAGQVLDPGEVLRDRAKDHCLAEDGRVDAELERVEPALV